MLTKLAYLGICLGQLFSTCELHLLRGYKPLSRGLRQIRKKSKLTSGRFESNAQGEPSLPGTGLGIHALKTQDKH